MRISSIVAVTADRHYGAGILPVCEFSGVQYVLGCCSGTATISRTVQWTLITDHDTALKLLPPGGASEVHREILEPERHRHRRSQAFLSNQWAAKINGAITPNGDKLPSWEG